MVIWGQGQAQRAAPPSAVSRLLQTLREETNPSQAVRDVHTIWETDRWFTFPKFEETAKNVAAIMRRAGLEDVEIGNAAGRRRDARRLLDDAAGVGRQDGHAGDSSSRRCPPSSGCWPITRKFPAPIGMWSGPTPAGGVVTEVVAGARPDCDGADLKGKLVLGQRGSKAALAKAGALGMISENTENRDLVDERGWVNSFGDNGWSFTKGSSPLVCFSITPRGSQLLRELLKKGPVKVRANVDSRYYAGVYPYVTGVIRGTDGANGEEVLSLGHLFEQGAHDNATGVASIIGAAETVNRLIQAGKLPRPKRTHPRAGDGRMLRHDVLPAAEPGPREADHRGDVHRFAGGAAESGGHRAHLDSQSAFRQVVRGCAGAAPGGGVLSDRSGGRGRRWSTAARRTTISAIRPSEFRP